MRRTPRNYDGTAVTTERLSGLLPGVLEAISKRVAATPDVVMAAWPLIVGEKMAPMAKAYSFVDGTLLVKVKNSTLYSLLERDKRRLYGELKKKFPNVELRAIQFRMG